MEPELNTSSSLWPSTAGLDPTTEGFKSQGPESSSALSTVFHLYRAQLLPLRQLIAYTAASLYRKPIQLRSKHVESPGIFPSPRRRWGQPEGQHLPKEMAVQALAAMLSPWLSGWTAPGRTSLAWRLFPGIRSTSSLAPSRSAWSNAVSSTRSSGPDRQASTSQAKSQKNLYSTGTESPNSLPLSSLFKNQVSFS